MNDILVALQEHKTASTLRREARNRSIIQDFNRAFNAGSYSTHRIIEELSSKYEVSYSTVKKILKSAHEYKVHKL